MLQFFTVFCAIVLVIAHARKIESQVPIPASSERLERHAPHHEELHHAPIHSHSDVVDFGAHTGDHGSFGWYADFPVHTDH